MIDDTNVDFDAGDEDEFGGGLEGSPLTLQEEIELEEAFQGTDEFLTEFRNALDNAGATAVAATTTDTLLFQTPFKSEAGQAITAAGDLVDELEGTAQALTLNEIGDAILASGMEDFLAQSVPFRNAEFCDLVDDKIVHNEGWAAYITPDEVFVPNEAADAWVVENGTRLVINAWDPDNNRWWDDVLFGFSPPFPTEIAQGKDLRLRSAGSVKGSLLHWVRVLEHRKERYGCVTATPPVGFPPVQPQPQPPPAAPELPVPLPPGVAAVWCGVEYTEEDIEGEYGPGWEWYPPQPDFGNPRLPTHSATFNPEDPGPQTDAEWEAQRIEELALWGPGELDPYYAENYLTFFRLPWGIPPGWEVIDDYKGPLKDNEAWVVDYFQTGVGDTAGLPFFNNHIRPHVLGGERTRIACIPDSGEKPPSEGKQPEFAGVGGGGGGAIPAPDCGEKIQICNWDDLAKILGGGEGGVGGTCKLWESCKSGVIYATSGGQEPRDPADKPVNAAQMGIPDLQKFIDSCANGGGGGEGEADVGGVAELEAKLKEMGVESGCAVLPAAAALKEGDFLAPVFKFFTGILPPGLDKVDGIWSFIRWIFPSDDPEFKGWGEKTRAHLDDMFQKMASAEGCDKPEFYLFKGMEVLVGFLQQWVGGAFTDPLTALQQQTRFYCPISVPSPGEATQAYLADTINRETLECWARAGGMMWDGWAKVVEANRAKLGVNELVQLLRRKEIPEVEFNARIRELGFLKPTEANEFKELGNVIPPISDLVRFMVRDTADKTIVNLFRMNEGFPEKFIDDIVDWSTDQGVDKKYMEHVWRAHWSLPSPTQLFSFLHRNSRLPEGDKARVDKEMIEKALIQQDILPFWIPMLMATSYRPLNRVDTRRAFDMGSIDKPQVVEAYLNQGYNDDNANILADFAERIRSQRFLKHQSIRKYAQGAINGRELEQWAAADGATPADFEPMQARAVDVMVADARLECVKSYEKRFQHGELSSNELTLKLNNEMLDAAQVEHIVKANVCKREAAGKQASISQLCKWFTEGILAEHEFFSRLLELNWDADDATRLIRDCQIQREAVLSKEAAKRLSDAMKRSKENERKLKQSAAAREKQRKQAITASRAASTRRLRIAKLLDKAASQYAKKAELEAVEALAVLSIIVKRLKAAVLFTEEEIAQALVFLTKESETTNPEALYVEVVTTLEQSILPTPVEG